MWTDDYIGIPFKADGRTRLGADCWGLVRIVYYERLGIELPDYANALGRDRSDDCFVIADAIKSEGDNWRPVNPPKPLDVALFRTDGIPAHLGIVVGKKEMLHTCAGIAACIASFTALEWRDRLIGFYRYGR